MPTGVTSGHNLEWLSRVASEEAQRRGLSEQALEMLWPVLEEGAARMDQEDVTEGDERLKEAETSTKKLVAALAEAEARGSTGVTREDTAESVNATLRGLCPLWPFCD